MHRLSGSSYIDELIRRDRDTDANGSLDELDYYCQNWHHDVVAIYDDVLDKQVEMVRYSAYGVPFGLAGGDMDSDGDCDSTDVAAISALSGSGYDVRADLDLDGVVDGTDVSVATSDYQGRALGREALSGAGNSRGYAGYCFSQAAARVVSVRRRSLDIELGRWRQRDPLGYAEGANQYLYGRANPTNRLDPAGLNSYGHYCGPKNDPGDPRPMDALDACCQQHDTCYENAGLSAADFVHDCSARSIAQNRCDFGLVLCALGANTSNFDAAYARAAILNTFNCPGYWTIFLRRLP